ncbi:MAG: glycosyltransferase [Bacilli bacterium]|nr:glycosyltransferase [Bacilli bacterium]
MPKVSVVVPVYNSSKYLNKCIDSLINQTFNDIEFIIINDGSTDDSEDIIKSYNDERIKYIKQTNKGIGKTRNYGVSIASGDYIMFIDSDDYIDYDCVEKMYNKAIETDSDLIVSDFFKDIQGKLIKITFPHFDSCTLQENPGLLNFINMGPCNKLYKKDLIKNIKFDEEHKYEDTPFVVKSLKNAKKITKIDECLSYYVIHDNSQTTTKNESIRDILYIMDILKKELNSKIYDSAFKELSVSILTDYIIQQRYIKNRKFRNNFIDDGFNKLYEIDPKWKKSEYLKRINFIKRFIKTHKFITKLYCTMYQIIH